MRLLRKKKAICVDCMVLPICSGCGKSSHLHSPQQKLCHSCHGKKQGRRKDICIICHRKMSVAAVSEDGPLCGTCYYHILAPKEKCHRCGHIRPVNIRIDGQPLCVSCGKRTEVCSKCGRIRIVKARQDGETVCPSCYNSDKIKTDEQFRLRKVLSMRLYHALRACGLKKKGSMTKDYRVDVDRIIKHLGPRPSPDHDLDHIVPLCAFDLTDSTQVRLAFSPENLQWLKSYDNKVKNGKWQTCDMEMLVSTAGKEF